MTKLTLALAASTLFAAACGVVTDPDDPIDEMPIDEEPTDEEPTDEEPTDEPAVAPLDGDSAAAPAQDVFLSITGTRQVMQTDAISAPAGDADDWLGFDLPNNSNPIQRVYLTLDCALDGDAAAQVRATLWTDGAATTSFAACNDGETAIDVDNTKPQLVQVHVSSAAAPVYVDYTLTVRAF
jgi:hypothetical protein